MTITNSTPQRALRGHLPQRPTPRAAATAEHHARLAAHLTPRDRWLARMLFEHKVCTTHQLVELAWPTIRAANHRLRDLYCWRVVDRFQPFVSSGTAPMHYVLDVAGAVALAYEDGLAPKDLGYRHEAAIGIAHSLRLAHSVGVNGFFTALVARSRVPASVCQLTAWWSELRCARHWGDIVRPDAYGRWREGSDEVEFFLEFDFGTESLSKLASKLSGYEKLAATTGIATPVLVWLPTARRETTARRALATALAALDRPALVPLATSAADLISTASDDTPATERWLPVPGPDPREPGRLRLAHLARLWPHPPTPPTTPTHAPALSTTGRAELAPPPPLPPLQPTYRIRR
ncbi:replication-relaxation family protein [Amycolatopsis sp.]|uniref:replication-relaxation family protein n=1 Tax=Amycolatopsis sp. TaxID=37632 RepID=UPI002B8F55D7|nr:replication-relaxation family protein [Amycolatopsis sp.]HVV12127.1 replication-relaxation family protein [Amycolatopsis sp.]